MMRNAGAAGFVTDGPMRDLQGIIDEGLPCWCTGLTPASPFSTGPGRVGVPVQIGGQTVTCGDMVIADPDGIVIVPFAEIDTVIARIVAIRAAEEALDARIREGLVVPPAIEELLAGSATRYE